MSGSLLPMVAALSSAAMVVALWRLLAPASPRLRTLTDPPVPQAPGDAAAARGVHRLVARIGGLAATPALTVRLRQAGFGRGQDDMAMLLDHQVRCVAAAGIHLAVAVAAGLTLGWHARALLSLAVLAAVAGAARAQARVDRLITQRRQRIQMELPTINQLLALDVRAGGGVAQALARISQRGRGVLAQEFGDVLAAARAGAALADALESAAAFSPEPAAARTYRLLAKGSRYGADLAGGLRALNDDLRSQRAEALERAATKRRAAMLVPIIALLAPVMLLFIAAPLPAIVFGMK